MREMFLNTSAYIRWCDWQVLYTLGGLENLQTAKKYYASTIDLTGGKNTRALFGICLVSFPSLSSHRCIRTYIADGF